ncbi:hypothetical protein PIB30_037954 [Stylosanthes scabra]|uniref:Uncharacterized protein n=1 Tax=Stylosanthes scabra TaxID=79078 RepID=A0ABU6WDJ7_9FABA|nr:hypothetical protein [Stylosanthes scabra]
MALSEILMSYFRQAGFGQAVMLTDFHFDLPPLGEDVSYHLGLCIHGDPVGGAIRDFETYYQQPTWTWVEQLLGARPEQNPEARKDSFSLKMVWLRQRMQHIPKDADPGTLIPSRTLTGACDIPGDQLTLAQLDDVWNVMSTSALPAHEIQAAYRPCTWVEWS